MQSQGVKYKLRKSLPEESGQAQTLNRKTPGFGQETPNFPWRGGTTDSSCLPSGQQTLSAQSAIMSPWLFAETEMPSLDLLDSIEEIKIPRAISDTTFNLRLGDSVKHDEGLILDNDELDRPPSQTSLEAIGDGEDEEDEKPEPVASCDPPVAGVYPIGSVVFYFSKSRLRWMKGIVMQMIGDFYLVDKGFGCQGKCSWGQLMNSADEAQHIYRLIDILDGIPLPALLPSTPRIIRDDFSSDED